MLRLALHHQRSQQEQDVGIPHPNLPYAVLCYAAEFYRKAYLTPKRDCALNLTDFKRSQCGFECASGGRADLTSFLLTHYRHPTLPYTPHTLTLNSLMYYYVCVL